MKKKLLPFNENKNGRYYDKDSYDWSKIIEKANNGTLLGEISHGGNKTLDVQLSNVTHSIKDIEIYDDGIWGEIEILDTPMGKNIKELKDSGMKFDVSSRANGTVDNNGKVIIGQLASFDLIPHVETSLEKRRKKLNQILKRIGDEK